MPSQRSRIVLFVRCFLQGYGYHRLPLKECIVDFDTQLLLLFIVRTLSEVLELVLISISIRVRGRLWWHFSFNVAERARVSVCVDRTCGCTDEKGEQSDAGQNGCVTIMIKGVTARFRDTKKSNAVIRARLTYGAASIIDS